MGIGLTNPASKLEVSGAVTATAYNTSSDRNMKKNFAPVCARDVLARLSELPIQFWNFKADAPTRHIGPMAQDFHAAFGVGTDDKHIATVDADGVALAALQGLHQIVREQEHEIADLKQTVAELKQVVGSLARTKRGNEQKVRAD